MLALFLHRFYEFIHKIDKNCRKNVERINVEPRLSAATLYYFSINKRNNGRCLFGSTCKSNLTEK